MGRAFYSRRTCTVDPKKTIRLTLAYPASTGRVSSLPDNFPCECSLIQSQSRTSKRSSESSTVCSWVTSTRSPPRLSECDYADVIQYYSVFTRLQLFLSSAIAPYLCNSFLPLQLPTFAIPPHLYSSSSSHEVQASASLTRLCNVLHEFHAFAIPPFISRLRNFFFLTCSTPLQIFLPLIFHAFAILPSLQTPRSRRSLRIHEVSR